ncbi:MAG TPA: DUF655 domain-containing protein [Allocoleopsis sp.]
MIDKTRPVYLRRMIIHPKTSNVLPPLNRPYQPGEIPDQFLTPEYVTQDPAPPPIAPGEPNLMFTTPDTIPERSLATTPLGNIPLTSTEGLGALDPGAAAPPVSSNPEDKVNINSDSTDVIAEKLDGIAGKTASKVEEARKQKPFESFSDLDERVPLVGGRKWETYKTQIVF